MERWSKEQREQVIALRASNPAKYGPTRISKETGIPIPTIKFWLDAASWAPKSKTGTKDRLRFQDWESWRGSTLRMQFLRLKKLYAHHGDPPTRQEMIAWVREAVMVCTYCQRDLTTKNFSVDHRQPVSRGGRSTFDNLVSCCKRCNDLKGALTEAEYRALLALVLTWDEIARKSLFARMRGGFIRTARKVTV